ncbi:MAG: hypothetical protein GWO40_07460, partial [Gammaproteobacteria bacterium]|nr:hypothetical protein [Gammaproteobacteria bacterium]NIV51429.1 hypothetical protein [Gammaproteobacteria bacterium]NIX85394.1 hypothetical protein [Gammaproteobacteria bacterium]
SAGLDCEPNDIGVCVEETSPSEMFELLSRMDRIPSADELSAFVVNLRTAKYDDFVPDALLRRAWAQRLIARGHDFGLELSRLLPS